MAAAGNQMLQPVHEGGETEPRISEELACHLKNVMYGKVPAEICTDTEYRRLGEGPKILDDMNEYAELIRKAQRRLNYNKSIGIRPDIIVHKRGAAGPNYFVIELKKGSNHSVKQKAFDRLKLALMTAEERQYRYGFGFEMRACDSSIAQMRKVEIVSVWSLGREVL
jgi:hypothetical protein